MHTQKVHSFVDGRHHRRRAGRRTVVSALLVASGLSVAMLAASTAGAAAPPPITPTTVQFTYTGADQTWTVPPNVIGPVSFELISGGGGGGASDYGQPLPYHGGAGGNGAVVSGVLSNPTPGSSFTIVIGGGGWGGDTTYPPESTWGGKGTGGAGAADNFPGGNQYGSGGWGAGGAGGGMSAIISATDCASSFVASAAGTPEYCAIAGGGGGGGGPYHPTTATSTIVGVPGSSAGPYQGFPTSVSAGQPGIGSQGLGGGGGGATGDGLPGTPGGSYVDQFDVTGSQISTFAVGGAYGQGGGAGQTAEPGVAYITYDQGSAPYILTNGAATFTAGQSNSSTLVAGGDPIPVWTEDGPLPAGVTLVDNGDGTATFSGTPTQYGQFNFTATATNEVAPPASQQFALTVDAAPTITSGGSATFQQGQAGLFELTTTGYPDVTWAEKGALPTGVSFGGSGGGSALLSGNPTESGTYKIAVTASNGVGEPASMPFTLLVDRAGSSGSTGGGGSSQSPAPVTVVSPPVIVPPAPVTVVPPPVIVPPAPVKVVPPPVVVPPAQHAPTRIDVTARMSGHVRDAFVCKGLPVGAAPGRIVASGGYLRIGALCKVSSKEASIIGTLRSRGGRWFGTLRVTNNARHFSIWFRVTSVRVSGPLTTVSALASRGHGKHLAERLSVVTHRA